MTEREVLKTFRTEFKTLFPRLKKARIAGEPRERDFTRSDLKIVLPMRGGEKVLVGEVAAQGYPKQLREKGLRALETSQGVAAGYPVIIAPHISQMGKEVCKKLGIGYLDLSGNAYLDFDEFYMDIEGRPSRFKEKREMRGLFTPRAERILRFYLLKTWPTGSWVGTGYREIAAEVSVSVGQVAKVNQKLDQLGFWIEESKGLKVLDRTKLVDAWRDNYRFDRSRSVHLYSLNPPPQVERELAEFCKQRNARYALTLFSAGEKLASFTRYSLASAYFSGELEELKKALSLKEVSSGANLMILVPYDEGVYYRTQEVKSAVVASPLQVYLDLYAYKSGRAREQAEFLRENVLKF